MRYMLLYTTTMVRIEAVTSECCRDQLALTIFYNKQSLVIEAARLASLNQTQQDIWEQSWIEGVPLGHDVVTNPTCTQPWFTVPIRRFVTLNRLRCGQATCADSLYPWGMIALHACPLWREPPDHKAHY